MIFFGKNDYAWVSQTQIFLYVKEDNEFRTENEKSELKDAKDEAEQWMVRCEEINEENVKSSSKTNKPPPFKKIKSNKVLAKLKSSEYSECKCNFDDPSPCSIQNNCHNVLMYFECHSKQCPAKNKCQNQHFKRGEQFSFQVKMTQLKGWGLFANENIPAEKFVIEYKGEVINSDEFEQRFNRLKNNKEENFYFLRVENNLYIDSGVYGNESRFINHSCVPNVTPQKWTVNSKGKAQIRIGFFSNRDIRMVC